MAAGAFSPLPPMPSMSDGGAMPMDLAGPGGGVSAAQSQGAIEMVRGALEVLLQANQIVMGIARQFPAAAEAAQKASDAIQQMAVVVTTDAETGQGQGPPPPGSLA